MVFKVSGTANPLMKKLASLISGLVELCPVPTIDFYNSSVFN